MFPPYMSECLPVSLMPNTHFFKDFFASICCYIIRIAMCPSTYLSHSYTQCLSYVSVSLSLPISLCFYVIMSVYHVYNCVRLSVTLMSYTCFHINSSYQLTNCVVTHVSLIARPPGCLFVFCIVVSGLLSSITFSTYYHHFFIIRLVCAAVVKVKVKVMVWTFAIAPLT